jgi:hypothetical protein
MECFCGCGRKIGFWDRTANSYGKTAKLFVGKLKELDLPEEEHWQVFMEDGHKWFDAYAAAVHGELALKTLSTRDWKRWRNLAYQVVKEAEANNAKLGDWIIEEGLTPTQAAEKMAAMSPEEQLALRQRLGLPAD